MPLDEASLSFSPQSLLVLNFALAFLMFSVSLFMQPRDFLALRYRPLSVVGGLGSQWLLLPGITVLIILTVNPHPGVALGMLMVASCPGGNVSNFLCLVARANIVLSVALTAVSTLAASFLTPLLFVTGAAIVARGLDLPELDIPLGAMLQTVLTIIALPLLLGLLLRHYAPAFANAIRKPLRTAAGLVLIGFIVVAFINNVGALQTHVRSIAALVALHNALALLGGYLLASALRLPESERRTVSIETGIQNSGLALVLIFNFFDGHGPMALVAAGWGVWHLVSGGLLATWWSRRAASREAWAEERA
jgi:bile acid:Na+ symporter, BASS family